MSDFTAYESNRFQGVLQRLSANGQRHKQAGVFSEYFGAALNPLNSFGNPIGSLLALTTPTRTQRDQAISNREILGNLFIPGRASYNTFKRIGYSIRSPEMLEEDRKIEEEQEERQKKERNVGSSSLRQPEKNAGVFTEFSAGLNPLNIAGTPIGSLLALTTPTRTQREQAMANRESWGNILIPGRAGYNLFKRLGHTIRSPEMLEADRNLEEEDNNKRKKGENGELVPGWLPEKYADAGKSSNFELEEAKNTASQMLHKETIRKLLRAAAVASGVGLAGRGALSLLSESTNKPSEPSFNSSVIPASVPVKRIPVKKDKRSGKPGSKSSSKPQEYDFGIKAAGSDGGGGSGVYPTKPHGFSYFLPAAVLGVPTAAAASFVGADSLIRRRKKNRLKHRLESAQQEYERELESVMKTSSCLAETDLVLSQVCSALSTTKEASLSDGAYKLLTWLGGPNAPGTLAGAYATAAIPLAALGFTAMSSRYDSQRSTLEKALRRQRSTNPVLSNSPIFVTSAIDDDVEEANDPKE